MSLMFLMPLICLILFIVMIRDMYKNLNKLKIIRIIKNIHEIFNNLMRKSPLIKEIVKIKIMEKMNITEEEYNKIDVDLLEIKQNKMMLILIDEKFKLFIDRNQDIPLNDTYNYLKNIDYYEGDLSCELIIV